MLIVLIPPLYLFNLTAHTVLTAEPAPAQWVQCRFTGIRCGSVGFHCPAGILVRAAELRNQRRNQSAPVQCGVIIPHSKISTGFRCSERGSRRLQIAWGYWNQVGTSTLSYKIATCINSLRLPPWPPTAPSPCSCPKGPPWTCSSPRVTPAAWFWLDEDHRDFMVPNG